jgi:hypothetical protein
MDVLAYGMLEFDIRTSRHDLSRDYVLNRFMGEVYPNIVEVHGSLLPLATIATGTAGDVCEVYRLQERDSEGNIYAAHKVLKTLRTDKQAHEDAARCFILNTESLLALDSFGGRVPHIYDKGIWHGTPVVIEEFCEGLKGSSIIHFVANKTYTNRKSLYKNLTEFYLDLKEFGIIYADPSFSNMTLRQDDTFFVWDFGVVYIHGSKFNIFESPEIPEDILVQGLKRQIREIETVCNNTERDIDSLFREVRVGSDLRSFYSFIEKYY